MQLSFLRCSMQAMATDRDVGLRIKRLRTQILEAMSQKDFARRLGNVSRGAVGNWELGKGIKRDNLQRIADEYQVSFDWLATGRGEPRRNVTLTTSLNKSAKLGTIPTKGLVEAGHWQDVDHGGNYEMGENVPSSSDYPLEWQYALIVRGESLNKVAKDGDRLVCLDLIKSMISLEDDDLVICERQRFNGQLIERTAKRVRMTLRGYELWPESEHPDHQGPIEWMPNGDPDENHVHVVAKVLWILKKP